MSRKIFPGQSSEDFPAIQEKNLKLLTEVLKKKEATDAITEMAKTKSETWENILASVIALKEIVSLGGTSAIIASFKQQVDDSISFVIADKLSTFENTLKTIIGDKLDPMLTLLNIVSNSLATYIADNDTGAFVGAMGGWLIGQIIPGGAIWTALGAIIGAWMEDIIERFDKGAEKMIELFGEPEDRPVPWNEEAWAKWLEEVKKIFDTKPEWFKDIAEAWAYLFD